MTGNDLRRFDISSQTASAPIATNVQSYHLSENNRVTFVATETKDDKTIQKVGIYNDGQTKTIKVYDKVEEMRAGLTRYRDKDYLAVARGEVIAIYTNPLDDDKTPRAIYLNSPGGIDWLNFSPSGRFVMAAYRNKIVNFDLDTNKNYSFELGNMSGIPQWVDDTHIVDTSNRMISLIEFDGSNSESVVSGVGRVVLSRDDKYLFSFDTANGTASMQRSKLYIE